MCVLEAFLFFFFFLSLFLFRWLISPSTTVSVHKKNSNCLRLLASVDLREVWERIKIWQLSQLRIVPVEIRSIGMTRLGEGQDRIVINTRWSEDLLLPLPPPLCCG
jgi:hypothetical protein